jgi:site-specific DNA-methyltransferase (adenine-specific)
MENQILLGDCREVLKSIPDNHFDSLVTDPPSGIGFLNLNWDNFKLEGTEGQVEGRPELLAFQNFLVEVFTEAYRVLKPGAFGLVWALPRTSHHTGMALERAGFEVRDRISHAFGCLSEDTELLTERGWEHYSSLVSGTLTVCYDMVTGDFSWQPIQQVYAYYYDDTAYCLRGDNTDQLVSREHRCLVERSGKQILAYAETLQQQESIPILEDVSGLLQALPVLQSQSKGQPGRESYVVCYQSGSQAIRASRFTTTNLVRVEPTYYKGMVWCIRTATGCFIARRNGKAFVTGNSGYKKGLDIEKSFLDGGLSGEAAKWSGYHTGLKPAIEDWWLVRKPLEGTIIENILKYGTGALDIDSSRVFTDWDEPDRPDTWKKSGHSAKPEAVKVAAPPGTGINCHPLGRWPADFILSHSPKCQRVGTKVLKGDPRGNCKGTRPGGFYAPGSDSGDGKPNAYVYGDQEIPIYECVDGCPVGILDRDSDNSRYFKTFDPDPEANFIYQAKPSTTEKNADLDEGLVNEHKTVKSLKLMSYLVRLVTPQGGYVLDPFAGSGTTLVAAAELNLGFLGIEKDDKTWPVLQNRVANVIKRLEQEREKSAVFDAMLELESE